MHLIPPNLGKTETKGSLDSLTHLQTLLREQQYTGFLQAKFSGKRAILFAYTRGVLAGSYVTEDGTSTPILQADLSSVWDGSAADIQSLETPGKVGRMMWLSLESTAHERREICDQADWMRQLQVWKNQNFTGLLEVTAHDGVAYLYFEQGKPIPTESVALGTLKLEPGGSLALSAGQTVQAITHLPAPESNSYQCFALRQSGLKWGNHILMRFQNVAGEKFAQVVAREISTQIQPWQWQITVEHQEICDAHFFPRVAAATHAYRAIFMGLGTQMEFIIGNTFTQRILSEMYYELNNEERTLLASHRLIPAAFSD